MSKPNARSSWGFPVPLLPRRAEVIPLVPRPSGGWRCPMAGCWFASRYPMDHPCPLVPAASGAPVVGPVDPVDRADPAALPQVLAGLHALGSVPVPPMEPSAEDFGAALAAWGPWVDAVRVLPGPVAAMEVSRGV